MKESKATLIFNNKGLLIALCCSAHQLVNVTLEDIGTLKLEEYDKATNFQSKGFFKRHKTRLLSRWHYGKKQGNNGF